MYLVNAPTLTGLLLLNISDPGKYYGSPTLGLNSPGCVPSWNKMGNVSSVGVSVHHKVDPDPLYSFLQLAPEPVP